MARPKADTAKIRALLITAAEKQLEQTDGRRLVLSDLAETVGMSQSYIHTFFPTKSDLVRALAVKWFETVETVSHETARAEQPAEKRLENWLLRVLRVKRDRFDANPKLFRAYLELASRHMDLIQNHVATLRIDLETILREMVAEQQLAATVDLFEDATLLFRTPQNIAAYRSRATDDAARAICKALVTQISREL